MAEWQSVISKFCSPAALGNIIYSIVAVEGLEACSWFDKYPHTGLAPFWKRAFRNHLTVGEYYDGLNKLKTFTEEQNLLDLNSEINCMISFPDNYPIRRIHPQDIFSKPIAEIYGDLGYVLSLLKPVLLSFSHEIGINCVGVGNSLEEIFDVLGQSIRESSLIGSVHPFFDVVEKDSDHLLDLFGNCSCLCMQVELVSILPEHYTVYIEALAQLALCLKRVGLAREICSFIK